MLNIIYCQIGFHTTSSAHPNRCPPQYHHPPSPPSHPHQPLVCSQYLRVSYGLPPSISVTFFSLPLPHGLMLFLRIHIRVKPYGICLSLYGLFHLASHSPVPSMLLQRAIFHSFSLPSSIPLYI